MDNPADNVLLSQEQKRYADVLRILSRSGLVVLLFGFLIYISGLAPPITPIEELPNLLKLRVHDYIGKTEMPTGWNWLKMLGKGEVISNLGIIYLSVSTIICFLSILPVMIKKHDIAYTIIILLEFTVIILSACGILNMGAH